MSWEGKDNSERKTPLPREGREEILGQEAGKGGADWLGMLVGLGVLEEGEQMSLPSLPSPTSPLSPSPLPQTETP